ncbi:lytic transglycosylase domain-containing protein [Tropicimonas sp. IMCC6043]|uniref:lytic transglycosylase domain-containing protein n=1 Tax=Tropicimonas sp. IMCC6043 TaxID=2510645 RepID=UPI00101C8F78|nr:lytic transglycosylase domain-containing protein [Tropicimonas sp. IMCC6043]RYH10705.1 lytic transglycosylase domain-containing protein [Tropicimonas sp. IMCC6043]
MRRLGWTALVALCVAAAAAPAEQAEGSKDFTFRRVKVGSGFAGARRGLVQIDPMEQARILKLNPAVPAPPPPGAKIASAPGPVGTGAPAAAPSSHYGWYWDLVSPAISDSGSGRLEMAEAALRLGPAGATVKAPRLASLQAIADRHGADILKATIGTKVSPALVLAVMGIESAGRVDAVSPAGATGLMQLMPATAERFGVANRTNAAENIRGGVAYLDWLLDHFDRDPILALAGYNAGENAVRSNSGVPPYAETRDYVPKVIAAWSVAKGLCLTPPQLVSDGCVFRRGAQVAQVVQKP